MSVPDDPARRRLERDLASDEFDSGVSAGMWRVVSLDWPELVVAITAADGNEVGMRLNVDGYPAAPPAGRPWDLERSAPLAPELWPVSTLAVGTFRQDWSVANGGAPYVACDRVALSGHPDWTTTHPDRVWNPGRAIAFYLREMHRELQSASVPQVGAAP
jgi:hypothetical protein